MPSQFVHEKESPRIYMSVHSGGFELTKLTYTRLEDNLIRHRGDPGSIWGSQISFNEEYICENEPPEYQATCKDEDRPLN